MRRFICSLVLAVSVFTAALAQPDPLELFSQNVLSAFMQAVPYVLATIGPIFIFSLLLRFILRKVRSVAR